MFNFCENMEKNKAQNLSPIVLAFVGDAVYSLFVRKKLTFLSDFKSGELNKLAVKEVCASSQASFVMDIIDQLTDEELMIFKRARNAKKTTRSKSASVSDYNASTGFEAVLGYLYLIGDIDRINLLLNKGKI